MNARLMAVLIGAGLAASGAQADIVSLAGSIVDSTEGTGATVAGTLEYTFEGGSSGSIVIELTNTSPGSVGGYLTGFVFNIGGGGSATLVSASNANFVDTGPEAAAPFGDFDAGAALGGNWSGGGSPAGGIGMGQSGSFLFALTSAQASTLTAASLLEGPDEFNMVARFRGLTDGGSDKVPLVAEIPAPMSAAVLGLAAVGAVRRRR